MYRLRLGINYSLLPLDQKRSTKITQRNVKLCELCGTLNLEGNQECWTCRWHGDFSRDEQTIALAWQRLETLYEEVRLEHITARRTVPLGDYGTVRPAKWPQRLSALLAARWQQFLDQRDLRNAQRQARLQTRMPTPPDQLSI